MGQCAQALRCASPEQLWSIYLRQRVLEPGL